MKAILLAAALGTGSLQVQAQERAPTGLRSDVSFSEYPKLAENAELARRSFSPLTLRRLQDATAKSGHLLGERAFEPGLQRFLVYAPPLAPAEGYGVIVFVSPSPTPRLPSGWREVLDKAGLIFICAYDGGNADSILGRREPLALMAAENVRQHYGVDSDRVYVAGFSGGSRSAMRLALAYPDVFAGAMLFAGSDPIGDLVTPIPPEPLFARFQEMSRVVYVTGERDEVNTGKDEESQISLLRWCAFKTVRLTIPNRGHELPDQSGLTRALRALTSTTTLDQQKLATCRSQTGAAIRASLERIRGLIADAQRQKAEAALKALDGRFGGLAAPMSVCLWQDLHTEGSEEKRSKALNQCS